MRLRERFGAFHGRIGVTAVRRRDCRALRPVAESLEGRALLATLAPIPNVSSAVGLGLPVVLRGGVNDQTYTVSSTNENIKATVVKGPFLKIDVSHASSGAGDPAFSGSMVFQLFSELTPTTVSRILELVESGFYTSPTENPDPTFTNLPSKNFHRVAQGFPGLEFIVQGGSKNGNGTGEINRPGFPFDDEFVASLVFDGKGQLAMANAGDDTNSSQFFVTTGQPGFLDFQHTIFGQIVSGSDIVSQMTQVARNAQDAPSSPILITGTTVSQSNPNGVVLIDTTGATLNQTSNITVTATDLSTNTTTTQTFGVTAVANTENQRPFLKPIGNQVVGRNQTARFTLGAVNTNPGDTLTFGVGGGVAPDGTFAPVVNATASVDAQGNVTVVPNAGFTGAITLLVGVRDQINRSTSLNSVANFDTQRITLQVLENAPPTATPQALTTTENTGLPIQLTGDTNNPGTGQTLQFILVNPPTNGQLLNFNANTGTAIYVPSTNFVGTDQFTFRVRDVGEPLPNLESANATVTITVQSGTPVNVAPTARPVSATTTFNTPVSIQLIGESNNPTQTVSYRLDTTGIRGSITSFDSATGLLTYVPETNYIGTDRFRYTVTDVGEPGPPLTSQPATVTVTIGGATNTGAVRQINSVLVVSPLPGRLRNPTPNTINVDVVDGRIVVLVNGAIDVLRPQVSAIDRVVVYGSKASDTIEIAPEVTQLVTLDGGLGGRNRLQAGNSPSRLHGWFGRNILRGGEADDQLIGRLRRVRFLPSGGNDLLFAGEPRLRPAGLGDPIHRRLVPPIGQFFRFVKGRPIPIPTPRPVPRDI